MNVLEDHCILGQPKTITWNARNWALKAKQNLGRHFIYLPILTFVWLYLNLPGYMFLSPPGKVGLKFCEYSVIQGMYQKYSLGYSLRYLCVFSHSEPGLSLSLCYTLLRRQPRIINSSNFSSYKYLEILTYLHLQQINWKSVIQIKVSTLCCLS